MTAPVVVLILLGLVLLDAVVRATSRRMQEKRARRERAAILETSLRIDFTHESGSLERVEVPNARARILAVDGHRAIRDAIRRILVLEEFSVDTLATGAEALGLVQRNDYDFVFVDLNLPDMDGVEAVQGVNHLRPDTDVAVITGYATVASAVQTMSHGAVDYLPKPFTAEQLGAFTRRLLIKREARHDAQRLPSVSVVAPALADAMLCDEYRVPGGAFVSEAHVWARIEPSGLVRVGLDDFARKALGAPEQVGLPLTGAAVRRGEPLFSLYRGERRLHLTSPLSGVVSQVNTALLGEPGRIAASPYERGWVCLLQPMDLAAELPDLRIGRQVLDWYRDELRRLIEAGGTADHGGPRVDWLALEEKFFPAAAPVRGLGAAGVRG